MQKCLDNNDTLMYSTHNKGKSVVTGRFTRTILIVVLLIKSQPLDAYYSASSKEIESSQKAPKFKVGDRVKIIKYKKPFTKGYTESWSRVTL